ncbi:MAG: dihydroorotate dehydrogenase-like protein [Candidatus Omnitrophota bacterium]
MDLTTVYMGLNLKNPLVVSSSPLTKEFDNFKKLEDAGVSAIVCHSIFEEQISEEIRELNRNLINGTESFAEALSYFPEPQEFKLGPDDYLEMIRKAKAQLSIPVIGSLNGHTAGGWVDYARKIEEAGADAIELNVFFLPTRVETTPDDVERNYEKIVHDVKANVKIPVAVKMSPYFSALANMAKSLVDEGADALVLFNRFYQPDIDIETLEVDPKVMLSTPYDLLQPLRWIGILYGQVNASFAATGGIHTARDLIKVIMAGADAGMMCSALLENGIRHAATVLKELSEWMTRHDYDSVRGMKGVMSQQKCAHPEAFERANYMKVLQSY